MSLSYMKKDENYMCHAIADEWYKYVSYETFAHTGLIL